MLHGMCLTHTIIFSTHVFVTSTSRHKTSRRVLRVKDQPSTHMHSHHALDQTWQNRTHAHAHAHALAHTHAHAYTHAHAHAHAQAHAHAHAQTLTLTQTHLANLTGMLFTSRRLKKSDCISTIFCMYLGFYWGSLLCLFLNHFQLICSSQKAILHLGLFEREG